MPSENTDLGELPWNNYAVLPTQCSSYIQFLFVPMPSKYGRNFYSNGSSLVQKHDLSLYSFLNFKINIQELIVSRPSSLICSPHY